MIEYIEEKLKEYHQDNPAVKVKDDFKKCPFCTTFGAPKSKNAKM